MKYLIPLVVFGVILASGPLDGYGKAQTAPPESSIESYFKTMQIVVPSKVIEAPDFTLMDLEGEERALSDFRGNIVFLNFWATWCGPCRFEMPSMQELHQELEPEGLRIVAVDLGESARQVNAFVKNGGLTFSVLLDTSQRVGANYGIRSIPTTYILDREGRIIGAAIGTRDWSTSESIEMFRLLLNSSEE